MTESEFKELDELSKLRGWTSLREEFLLSQNTNEQKVQKVIFNHVMILIQHTLFVHKIQAQL